MQEIIKNERKGEGGESVSAGSEKQEKIKLNLLKMREGSRSVACTINTL